MFAAARKLPNVEDVERVRKASPISPGVREQREQENEVAKLAALVDREQTRRKKGKGTAADEALARAEAILAAAESKQRKVHTHSGREVPLAAIRETALKRLEIEFGADTPVYVTCAHCGKVFAVKAGTAKGSFSTTCPRGCKCACGARVSRNAALRAAKDGRRAKCLKCSSTENVRKMHAKMTHERRAECGRKAFDAMTPEQRVERMSKARATLTRDQRVEYARKASSAWRAKSAARTHCSRGHEFAVVGRRPSGACCECERICRRARRAAARSAK